MIKHYLIYFSSALLLFSPNLLQAQCLPESQESFFSKLKVNNRLPERLLNGRTVLFYEDSFTKPELEKIQSSFSNTGIDAIVGIGIEKLLAGQDVAKVIFNALQKREVSNLIFFLKDAKGYECIVTKFNNKPTFIAQQQSAWKVKYGSLNELLLQLNREVLSQYKKQNLLISEQPELDFPIALITGSRIEAFAGDLRADRLAVRLSNRVEENEEIKNVCKQYPFKIEFVADSISDAELRQKGYWFVLNCVHGRQQSVRALLGYTIGNAAEDKQVLTEVVYKFYIKKLEYDHVFLGKQWDIAPQWQQSLENFIGNLRQELNFK